MRPHRNKHVLWMWNLPFLAWNASSTTIVRGLTGGIICQHEVPPSTAAGQGTLAQQREGSRGPVPTELSGLTSCSITHPEADGLSER